MLSYEYAPISSTRSFRLVNLLPLDISTSPPTLRLAILEHSLDSTLHYDALSYNWAVAPNQTPDRPVTISTPSGPCQLLIHKPLETALLHLATATSMPHPIFIDQICINQRDSADKAAQVPLMGAIYTGSARVLVWVGPATPASDDYFRFVRHLNASAPLARIVQLPVDEFLPIYNAIEDPSLHVAPAVAADRDAVLALIQAHPDFPLDSAVDVMARPWFTRIWTVQELCLPQEAVFVCGSEAVCITCFRAGMLFYSMHNAWWLRNIKGDVSAELVDRRHELFKLNESAIRMFRERRVIHGDVDKSDLFDVVVKYNLDSRDVKIGATMAEDRVFGLMGLAREEEIWKGVRVRYGDGVGVYTEFAGLMAARRADLLLFSQFPKRMPGLPSWVPDWTAELRVPHGYVGLGEPAFKAGGRGAAACRVDPVSKCLVVDGIILDWIHAIGMRAIKVVEENRPGEGVDYVGTRHFFDEIDEFVQWAANIPASLLHGRDADQLAQTAIRLSDFGLTEKHLSKEMPTEAVAKTLHDVHEHVSKWGQVLINTERTVQSHYLGNAFRTVTLHPWYWAPPNEIDLLRRCAVDPRKAGKSWIRAAFLVVRDVAGVLGSSALMNLVTWYIDFRRRSRGYNFEGATAYQKASVNRFGLDVEMVYNEHMTAYRYSLARNAGQRVYITSQGFVGLCPVNAKVGDAVAVVLGGSVPHILRQRGGRGPDERWQYIGGTYCDGIMEGELVGSPSRRVEELHLE
ncbi:hypothetical protein ACHAQA_007999 [Verticillium albo-atrum]